EPLFPSTLWVLAAGAGYACRWDYAIRRGGTEGTRDSEDNCGGWLLHSYDGTGERHVSDDLRPRRVGTVRRTRNRMRWRVCCYAERGVTILDLACRYGYAPSYRNWCWVLSGSLERVAARVSARTRRVRDR